MNNKILCIGDLHLGVSKNSSVFFDIALKYADWIVELCEKHHISTIIQMGDVFHDRTHLNLNTLNCADKFFDKLQHLDIHLLCGNHDCVLNDSSEINSLKLFNKWNNITVHEKVSIVNNLCLCGWGTRIEDIPDSCDAIFGHFDIRSFYMSSSKISEHGFNASELMNKCDILFSGHYHKPQTRLYDKKPLVYTGSAYQLNWGESGEDKFVYILDTETLQYETIKNTISPRFEYIRTKIDNRKVSGNFVSVELDNPEEFHDVTNKFKKLGALDVRIVNKPMQFIVKSASEEIVSESEEENPLETNPIYSAIDEYVETLEGVDDSIKKIVAERSKRLYDKCI